MVNTPTQEALETARVISRHREPQVYPQEWECGCVTSVYITDADPWEGGKPFEMRLAVGCSSDRCQIDLRDEKIRDTAVRNVDARYGFTCEFHWDPDSHRRDYDLEEDELREEAGLPPAEDR